MSQPTELAIFRDRLKRLVAEDGRPVAEIARVAGLNRQLVYQIFSGYRPNPSVETVGKLLNALRAKWADLD